MIYNLKTPQENYAEIMRAVRDQLLAQSDWAMAADAPTDKTAWASYRQALRDYPATWKVAETADFPETPA
jgi:hypothetical protein